MSEASGTRWRTAGAVSAFLVAGGAGLFWLRCMYIVLRSRLSTDPLTDPHGYELLASTVLALPAAIVLAIAVPFVVEPGARRARLAKIAATLLVVLTALPLTALLMG
ncbi:hypothetical protein ACFWUP_23430 [Nocardia sp. NPDC058658]|uniref:hypothetical protein n=1 Tax=Nocardia sp. NPDC058658 TaxID=3346580 RepID=UPI00364C1895